jgi:hypothetical protein
VLNLLRVAFAIVVAAAIAYQAASRWASRSPVRGVELSCTSSRRERYRRVPNVPSMTSRLTSPAAATGVAIVLVAVSMSVARRGVDGKRPITRRRCMPVAMPRAGFEPALQEEAGGKRAGSKRAGDQVGYLNPHLQRLLERTEDADRERRR